MMAVRCIVKREDSILLCYLKSHSFYFLPGGSIEHQEEAIEAIYREFKEEMGIDRENIDVKSFLCLMEVMYDDLHSLDPIFKVDITDGLEVVSVEDHIDFKWVKLSDIENIDLKPPVLKKWISNDCLENHIVYNDL